MMDAAFLAVLNMSLVGTFVIAMIMLVRPFFKKVPKAFSYALWSVVGFRLVSPVSVSGLFSLIPFKSSPIPKNIAIQPIPKIDSGVEFLDRAVSDVLPSAPIGASVNPLQVWLSAVAVVWVVGMVCMITYGFVSIHLLKRRLLGAEPSADGAYEVSGLETPFVIGLLRPKIYIPKGIRGLERRYVLLHEETHIKRLDHVVKILAYLVLCLHWFNPFAWLAFALMGQDMEMSCDERVLEGLGPDVKREYSKSLVKMATYKPAFHGSPLAFGEGGVKGRVKNVLDFKKPSRRAIVVSMVVLAVLVTGCAINQVGKAADNIPALTITTPRRSFSPLMSSMFGFELVIDSPETATEFLYVCDDGSFCAYGDDKIIPMGDSVTTSETLYWWPFGSESTAGNGAISGDALISVTALDIDGNPLAHGSASVKEVDGFYTFLQESPLDEPADVILAELDGMGYEVKDVHEYGTRFVEHSENTASQETTVEDNEVASVYAEYADTQGEIQIMNYTLRRPAGREDVQWVFGDPIPWKDHGTFLRWPQIPTGEPYSSAANAARQFYMESGYPERSIVGFSSIQSDFSLEGPEFLEQLKDETVTLGVEFLDDQASHPLRFIVLTREKDGPWEVVQTRP